MNLIISPHADDEVFGAFCFLKDSVVCYIGIDESKLKDRPTFNNRLSEVDRLSKLFGAGFEIFKYEVNHYEKYFNEILADIEDRINKYKPETILIPPPDYNQDHKTIYNVCMIALRHHDKNHFVKRVLVYETPSSWLWGEKLIHNYFREIDIKKKLKALKCYKTQIRPYRSLELVKYTARIRGYQSNLDYAEGFKILRWVE